MPISKNVLLVKLHVRYRTSAWPRQSLESWPTWPQFEHAMEPLHVLLPWPNLWHLKHRNGLGMYTLTGTRRKPILRCLGMVCRPNVTMNVLVLRRPPVGFDRDVADIFNKLLFKFGEYLLLVAVEQFFAENDTFSKFCEGWPELGTPPGWWV